jgi:hypothetical protein
MCLDKNFPFSYFETCSLTSTIATSKKIIQKSIERATGRDVFGVSANFPAKQFAYIFRRQRAIFSSLLAPRGELHPSG